MEPRQVTQKFLDEHDFLMIVPEFMVRGTGRPPDHLIMDMAEKDLKTFEVFAKVDDLKYGLKRGELKYFKPHILPIKEFPARYEALRKYIEETVKLAKESKKIEFNAELFSFEFDEPDVVQNPELKGIPNIKYFRIVRLVREGENLKMDVPNPSFFIDPPKTPATPKKDEVDLPVAYESEDGERLVMKTMDGIPVYITGKFKVQTKTKLRKENMPGGNEKTLRMDF